MTTRNDVIAVLEEALEELNDIAGEKLAPYAMNPDFPEPDKARELGLTVEEMKGIDDVMVDVLEAYRKLGFLLEKMEGSETPHHKDDKNIPSEEENPRVEAFRKLAEATAPKTLPIPKE